MAITLRDSAIKMSQSYRERFGARQTFYRYIRQPHTPQQQSLSFHLKVLRA